jgi:ATP-dependent Clp protease protease subunit
LSTHTGKSTEQIAEEIERDRYMSADEAKEWCLIDEVLHEQEKKDKK